MRDKGGRGGGGVRGVVGVEGKGGGQGEGMDGSRKKGRRKGGYATMCVLEKG